MSLSPCPDKHRHILRISVVMLVSTLLGACSSLRLFDNFNKGPLLPAPLVTPPDSQGRIAPDQAGRLLAGTQVQATPRPPSPSREATLRPSTPPRPDAGERADITLMFDQLPLPTFIQVVYGTLLKKNFSVDPQVAQRNDLVTVRAGRPQTPTEIENAARMLLKSYGVAVMDLGAGMYRIVPDNAPSGYLPEIKRGRAQPDTPLPLRPVFQLVELSSVRQVDVAGWLRTMFGQRVTVAEDPTRNALLLSGQGDNVTAAIEAIQVLDQPLMRGRGSVRISPAFWSVDELAKRLSEILQAEGYVAGTSLQTPTPIILLPIAGINALIIFAADPQITEHVVKWAQEIDRPAAKGAGGGYFTYRARYSSAQDLAKTIQDLLSGTAQPNVATTAVQPNATATPVVRRATRVVVDAGTNTLIFQGNPDEYTQILSLLQELDKPSKAALIEVTVAEVTLDDDTKLGIEWAIGKPGRNGSTWTGGTLGGLNIGTSGFVLKRLDAVNNVKFVLNALASTSKANVLSTPRILARNGETATIQVGSQLPTITQQQTSAATGSGSILQSVQYVNTGIILKVKPVIHSGDRIELEVSQEVSDSTKTGVAGSPVIDTRKLETKLALRDGSTVLLGGLMSRTQSRADQGLPLLKDIPVLGQAFRTNDDKEHKTELLVLITPYIVADDFDAEQLTDAFRQQLGPWAYPHQDEPGFWGRATGTSPQAVNKPVPRRKSVPGAAAEGQGAAASTPSTSAGGADSTSQPAPAVPGDETGLPSRPAPPAEQSLATPEAAPAVPSSTVPQGGAQVIDPKELEELQAMVREKQKEDAARSVRR